MKSKAKEILIKIGLFSLKISLYYGVVFFLSNLIKAMIITILWHTGNLPEFKSMFKGSWINTESLYLLVLSITGFFIIPSISLLIVLRLKRLSQRPSFKKKFPKVSKWIFKNFEFKKNKKTNSETLKNKRK